MITSPTDASSTGHRVYLQIWMSVCHHKGVLSPQEMQLSWQDSTAYLWRLNMTAIKGLYLGAFLFHTAKASQLTNIPILLTNYIWRA